MRSWIRSFSFAIRSNLEIVFVLLLFVFCFLVALLDVSLPYHDVHADPMNAGMTVFPAESVLVGQPFIENKRVDFMDLSGEIRFTISADLKTLTYPDGGVLHL